MRIRKIINYTVVLAACFTLLGCPFSAKVPITKPIEQIDQGLLGKWVQKGDSIISKPQYYRVERGTDMTYDIIKHTYSSYDTTYKKETYRAHTSTFDGVRFLNIQKKSTGDYYFYKLEKASNGFKLIEITDNITDKFSSSTELEQFVRANMHLSFFYNKDATTYIRRR